MLAHWIENAATLADAMLGVYFTTRMNGASFRRNYLAILTTLLAYGVTWLGDRIDPGFGMFSIISLWILMAVYSLLISRRNYGRSILAASIYVISLMLVGTLIYSAISTAIHNFDALMQGEVNTFRYLYLLLHKVFFFLVLQLFLVLFRTNRTLNRRNSLLTILFSTLTALGLSAVTYITARTDSAVTGGAVVFLTVILISVNVLLYILIYQVQKLQKAAFEAQMMEEKMRSEEAYYQNTHELWEEAQMIRHDIRNQLLILSSYLEKSDVPSAQHFLQKNLLETVNRSRAILNTNNSVIDIMINRKLGSLQDVDVRITGVLYDLDDILEKDLSALLGNILDNAVEAVATAPRKRIEIHFDIQNNNRLFTCCNTVAQPVQIKEGVLLPTTKPDPHHHGYGLRIIAHTVSKYNGLYQYFMDDRGMFCLQVILPFPSK